jgi:MFS family permease
VGTLAYTRRALVEVVFWMLWGDFVFQLMGRLPATVIPLQLRWAGASDTVIGLVGSSLPAVVSFFLSPVVGVQSDRHRGRLGRRRPFLKWCTPPVVLSLVLLGAARPAGGLLHRLLGFPGGTHLTAAALSIAWIGVCTFVFVIFNNYTGAVYQYMFADVIPREVMGRFTGLYRAVGAGGCLAFDYWAFGFAQTRTFHLYVLVALLYAGAFSMIVWRVKEGEYPPPEPKPAGGRLGAVKGYLRECFTHRFYLNYYCLSFFFYGTLPALSFVVFFATQAGKAGYAPTLGLTLQQFGRVQATTFLAQIPVFFLIGPVVDRFHGIRIVMVGLFASSLTYLGCFWLIHDRGSLLLWLCLNQAALAVYSAAGMSLAPLLLPRDRYGQFLSANSTLGWVTLVVTPPLWGLFLETVRDYRYVFLICAVCTLVASLCSVALFLQWRRLGGDRGYAPP